MVQIARVIDSIQLPTEVSPQSGDCGSFAVALSQHVGIKEPEFFCTYIVNRDIPHRPYHICLRTDDGLYDSTGRVTREQQIRKVTQHMNPSWSEETRKEIASKNAKVLQLPEVRKTDCYSKSVKDKISHTIES